MKKNKLLILVILLSWLSLSSITINASAVKWPLVDKFLELDPMDIGKLSIKENTDHTLYFTFEITSDNYDSEDDGNISIIMFLGEIWADHKTEWDYLYSQTFIDPIENLTVGTHTFSYFFTDDLKYYPAFINWDSENEVNVSVFVTKEEHSTVAYYFGGVVTLFFIGTLFWLKKKKTSLTEEPAVEAPYQE